MALRVLAGLALWLALAALPVVHLGAKPSLLAASLLPLPLLFFRRTSISFALAILPLCVLQPDLLSPRVHGSVGIIGGSVLLACYLVLSLRAPTPSGARSKLGARRRAGAALVAVSAVLCALGVATPYLGPVADALRRGYPAEPGAAMVLLAIGLLAVAAGLVFAYAAAPLDDAAGERS